MSNLYESLAVVFGFGGEARRILKTEAEDNNGLAISTMDTPDEGFETAVVDANHVYPVERYLSEEEAIEGHKRWIDKSKELTTVEKLEGMGGFAPKETVILKRIISR